MFGIVVAIVIGVALLIGYVTTERTRLSTAQRKYAGSDPILKQDIINKIIRIGMPEQQVIDSWGSPSRRTVTRLKTKTRTTLHFGTRSRVASSSLPRQDWQCRFPQ